MREWLENQKAAYFLEHTRHNMITPPLYTPILGHHAAIGHSSHFGALAVQISRPSEIMFTCSE